MLQVRKAIEHGLLQKHFRKGGFHYGNCISDCQRYLDYRSGAAVLQKNFREYHNHKRPESAVCFPDCTMRWFLCPVPFRRIGYQRQFLSSTILSEYILCADVSLFDCLRPVGSKAKKAKACPDDCLLLRCVDCSAVLCFSI